MALASSLRLVLFGTTAPSEIWETGVWLTGATATTQEATQAAVDAAQSGMVNLLVAIKARLSVDGAYAGLRAYSYPQGGTSASFVAENTTGAGAGTGTGLLPVQTCMVVTLLTGAAGRRNRGRMYFPAYGETLTGDSQFNIGSTDSLTNTLATWFENLKGGNNVGVPSVYSKIAGSARPINLIRADTRPDVQRRRANRLAASGSSQQPVT